MRAVRILAGIFFALCLALSAKAQTTPTLPVEITVPADTYRFVGSDGRSHFCYEVVLTNLDRKGRKLTLIRVEIIDPANSGTNLATFAGPDLEKILEHPGAAELGARGREFASGSRATLWVWLTIEPAQKIAHISHRFTFGIEGVDGEKILECCSTNVVGQIETIPAPFRGGNWVAANGPSNTSDHRRAISPIYGQLRDGQRFAIDWVRLGEDGKPTKNAGASNADYYGYGQQVYAIADSKVADLCDGIPENNPGSLAVKIDIDTIAGNFVILDLGRGIYAGYAHLKPGSVRVKKGERVHRGDIVGLLGNSGNSDAPHLHFQLMNGASILDSQGLPYLLERFTLIGTADANMKFVPAATSRDQKNELPLENVVVSFPDR